MNCPFCETDNDRNRIIRRFKTCYVMFANPRLVPGHLLVIPYRHVARFSELDHIERQELLDIIIEYQEKILKHYPGTQVQQNYMPFVPDSRRKVTHLHVHIKPRDDRDEIYLKVISSENTLYTDLTESEANEWMQKLV